MATDAGPGRKGAPVTEPTVILVHGAMHTPWIFHRLRAELDARGIASLAVQLPSSHPDSTRARGLPEDVAAVEAAVDEVDGPVVLAAHSYGASRPRLLRRTPVSARWCISPPSRSRRERR